MSRLYRYFTYNIKFGCGHEGTLSLKFEAKDLEWYEKHGKCKECYRKEQEKIRAEREAEKEAELQATCKEVEMHYSEYKNNYADCNTKKGSYNAKTKTIIVFVSAEKEAEIEADKAEDEAIVAIADAFGYNIDIAKGRKGIDKANKDKEKDKDAYLADHYRTLLYRRIDAEDFEEAKTKERSAKLLEIRKNFQLKIGWIKEDEIKEMEKAVEDIVEDMIIEDGVLVDGTKCSGDVVIPDGVTKIAPRAFKCCELTSIVIPESVTAIEREAFIACEKLKNIIIPDSVVRIEDDAFSYCSSLTEVVVPATTKMDDGWAFYHCENLKTVIVNDDYNDVSAIRGYCKVKSTGMEYNYSDRVVRKYEMKMITMLCGSGRSDYKVYNLLMNDAEFATDMANAKLIPEIGIDQLIQDANNTEIRAILLEYKKNNFGVGNGFDEIMKMAEDVFN